MSHKKWCQLKNKNRKKGNTQDIGQPKSGIHLPQTDANNFLLVASKEVVPCGLVMNQQEHQGWLTELQL